MRRKVAGFLTETLRDLVRGRRTPDGSDRELSVHEGETWRGLEKTIAEPPPGKPGSILLRTADGKLLPWQEHGGPRGGVPMAADPTGEGLH